MRKFKQIIFLYLFILSTILGCVGANLESTSVPSAMFTVDEITGNLNISKQDDALPKTFTLKLHACIRARLRNQPLPFTDYAITHDKQNFVDHKKSGKLLTDIKISSNLKTKTGKEIIRVRTDGNGCLNWTEEFDYAYYNQSQWIVINRYIQGLSTGWPGITGNIPVAINPWLQLAQYKHLQVVDYRDKYGHKEDSTLKSKVTQNGISFLQQQKKQEAKNKVNIIIDKLNFSIEDPDSKEGKQMVKAYIEAKVNYTIKDILGNKQDHQINTGNFIIKPTLLIKTRRPKHLIENQTDLTKKNIKQYFILNEEGSDLEVNTNFRNNQLVSDTFTWTIPYASYSSSISLYMKVIPQKQTADHINSFEGIYSFGPIFRNISQKQQELKLHSDLAHKHYTKVTHLDHEDNDIDVTSNNKPLNTSADQCLKDLLTRKDLRHAQVITKCVQKDKPDGTWDGLQYGGWTLDPLEINYVALKKENWLFRKISTEISTFVRDPLFNQTINAHEIQIKIIDLSTGKEEEITDKSTANNGQIKFNVSTEQYWYKKQRYFLKIIHFYTETKEIDVKKIIAINPWDYGWTHGFEVNQVDDVRSTCLKNDNKIEHMIAMLDIKSAALKKNISKQQLELIQQAFCYIPKNSNQLHQDKSTWIKVITFFKEVLQSITNKHAFNKLDKGQIFGKQFTSAEEIPAGRSYIHLFRAINKFPTLLLDHSLNRSLFYNLRIKLTPRVVRMDSLNKGQQDKGPLRDGVYVLQMALLKNKQERQNGKESGAINEKEFTIIQPSGSISYTAPLYPCLSINDSANASPTCITKEDFLIPPMNIPVITRDGIIRTDIAIPIARKNLMFANSKNILVFRILPADPHRIKCKDGTSGTACVNNRDFDIGYDWEKSLPIIQPARKELYDMIFYTYKTPFIPSLWNNWTINMETTSFSKIEHFYDRLTTQANSLKNEIDNTEKQTDQFLTKENDGQVTTSFNHIIATNKINVDKHQTLGTHEQLNQENSTETNIFDTLQTDDKQSNNVNDPANSITCPTVSIDNKTYPVLPKDSHCKCLPSARNGRPIEESAYCANQREKQNINLSNQHIAHFAASNALCVIPINSKSNVKICGNFSSSKEIEEDFLDSLNNQIKIINAVKKETLIANYVSSPYRVWLKSTETEDPNSINKLPEIELKKILVSDHTFSKSFRNKINKLPTLPNELLVQNIESIIQSGINTHNMDLNQIAFIHALCGFWFEKFYADYTNTELLKDSLKKTIRNTFYYKLRGINPLPANANNTSEENNTSNNDINNAMDDLQVEYTNYLKDMHLKGHIDDVHNWVNGEKEYGFDSNFHHQLEQRLEKVSKTSPFATHIPSWENKKNNNTFNLSYYLNEAKHKGYISSLLMGDLNQPQSQDRHPVRKCFNNPSHFFGFEQKTIAGQISPGITYETGDPRIWTINEEFMINTQRDQGSNQDASTSLGSNLSLIALPMLFATGAGISFFAGRLALPAFFNKISNLQTFSTISAVGITTLLAAPSASWNYKTYEGSGKRRLISYRVGEQVKLMVEHAKISIPLKTHHKCLVIRPRLSAFESYSNKYKHIWADTNKVIRSMYESMGILLCTEGTKKEFITEDYYYIYPDYPINGITMDTSNYRNKPFIISLRGQNEFNKFKSDLSCWITENKTSAQYNTHCRDTRIPYDYLLAKRIEFVRQLRAGFDTPKLFHQTQISPGVHSPPMLEEDRDIRSDPTVNNQILNWMAERQFMDSDIEKFIRDTPQNDE